jgi:hypothetical protein
MLPLTIEIKYSSKFDLHVNAGNGNDKRVCNDEIVFTGENRLKYHSKIYALSIDR